MPILSISSSMNTGLDEPAVLMFWMTRPGRAPMYVRRWPRISASSWMPPRLIRTNLRPIARATRLAQRRLADAGGPDEREDRAADRVRERAHRQVLEDALLDLLEAVVVLVEDDRGLADVEVVLGRDVPGQADEPVHVGADDADLGGCGRDPAHALDFLERAGLHVVGHARALDLLAELVDLGLLRVVLAELALDGLQLLAEDVLALGLVELRLDLGLDAALQLEDLDLAGEEGRHELEPLDDVERLEQLLALLGRHVRAVRDHVGEQARLRDVACRDGGLRRHGRARLDVLLDLALHGAHERLDLDALGLLVGEDLDARRDERVAPFERDETQALLALDDGTHGAVLGLHDLGDLGERADRVELAGLGDVLPLGLALGHERDERIRGHSRVECLDRLLAADLERHDHLREDDRLSQRDEWQDARLDRG